jgi:hypothetical protein
MSSIYLIATPRQRERFSLRKPQAFETLDSLRVLLPRLHLLAHLVKHQYRSHLQHGVTQVQIDQGGD